MTCAAFSSCARAWQKPKPKLRARRQRQIMLRSLHKQKRRRRLIGGKRHTEDSIIDRVGSFRLWSLSAIIAGETVGCERGCCGRHSLRGCKSTS
jgi:hypothetical protein